IAIWRPGGYLVAPGGAAGILDTEMMAGRIVTVKRPESGSWRVRAEGGGEDSISVRAKTELDLGGFDFVRLGGRPGHEGLFRIPGEPTSAQQVGQARLHGSFQTANFKLIAESGETIREVRLQSEGDREEFTGALTLPASPFRVTVEGMDERGFAYQRVHTRLFQIQSIGFPALPLGGGFGGGTVTGMLFRVQTGGTAGNLEVGVVWGGEIFVRPPPVTKVALSAGAAANVEADIDVPADAV